MGPTSVVPRQNTPRDGVSPMTTLRTPPKRSPPLAAPPGSPPKRRTRCTCLRISSCNAANVPEQFKAYVVVAQIPAIFVRGMAAAAKGSTDAQKSVTELKAIREQYGSVPEPFVAQVVRMTEIQELEIGAVYNVAQANLTTRSKTCRKPPRWKKRCRPRRGRPL